MDLIASNAQPKAFKWVCSMQVEELMREGQIKGESDESTEAPVTPDKARPKSSDAARSGKGAAAGPDASAVPSDSNDDSTFSMQHLSLS